MPPEPTSPFLDLRRVHDARREVGQLLRHARAADVISRWSRVDLALSMLQLALTDVPPLPEPVVLPDPVQASQARVRSRTEEAPPLSIPLPDVPRPSRREPVPSQLYAQIRQAESSSEPRSTRSRPDDEPLVRIRTQSGKERRFRLLPGAEFRPGVRVSPDVQFYLAGDRTHIGGTHASAAAAREEFAALAGAPPEWCFAVDQFDPEEPLDGVLVQ